MTDNFQLEQGQEYQDNLDEMRGEGKWDVNYTEPLPRDYTGLPLWTDAMMLTDEEFYELQELRKQYPATPLCDTLLDFFTGEEIP